MTPTDNASSSTKRHSLSLDTWAVIVALLLALAVRLDIFKAVPW
jgi:hypothetical protein